MPMFGDLNPDGSVSNERFIPQDAMKKCPHFIMVPEHYREASPIELDIHCKQLVVHGTDDDIVPVAMSRDYVKLKQKKNEEASFLQIPKVGHFEIVDPESKVWSQVEKAIVALV